MRKFAGLFAVGMLTVLTACNDKETTATTTTPAQQMTLYIFILGQNMYRMGY